MLRSLSPLLSHDVYVVNRKVGDVTRLCQIFGMSRSSSTVIASNNQSYRLNRRYSTSGNDYFSKQDALDLSKVNVVMEDAVFDALCDSNTQRLSANKFLGALSRVGLNPNRDPRLKECLQNFYNVQHSIEHPVHISDRDHIKETEYNADVYLDKSTFKQCIAANSYLIIQALQRKLVIPEWQDFIKDIEKIYWNSRTNTSGKVANYIPHLSRFSPDLWGVSLCTVDGQRYSIGDTNVPFCLQSCSKPFGYALALSERGSDTVHHFIGREPSGQTFNKIIMNKENKPHNPMVNAGAICICSLLKPDLKLADRYDWLSRQFQRVAGGEFVGFSNATFLSERESADRNFSLGYFMKEKGCFPKGTNLMETLDFYFQLCSIEVNCESGALMAAALANGGICPTTDEKVFEAESVQNTLSLMHSCGMYDYSGQFAFQVGLPAKSGVSGCILLVVPNVMGVCLWSPPLDTLGNSCRGLQFCDELVKIFNFHNYDNLMNTVQKKDPRRQVLTNQVYDVVQLMFGTFNGDISAIKRYKLKGMDMNCVDYDARTPLHIAASEGHVEIVLYLLEKCNVNPEARDRWGHTPLEEAIKFNKTDVVNLLEAFLNRKVKD